MEENKNFVAGDEQQDLLADESYEINHFVYATQGQRFLNWLIDNLLMRYGLSYLSGMGIGFIIGIAAPEFIENNAYDTGMSGYLVLITFLVGYLNYIVYYTVCEKLFKGYTLGKLITGTRAIRQDGG